MAALTKDRDTLRKDGGLRGYPVKGSTTIFKGSIVAVDDNGWALPAADAAAQRVIGVAAEKVINSGADGAKKIRVESGKDFLFNATSITQAMLGDRMHVVDDNTFDDAVGTNTIPCGRLVEFVSTTSGYIHIPMGGLIKGGTAVVDAVS